MPLLKDKLLENISSSDFNKLADTIELMAIFSKDKLINASIILDRLSDKKNTTAVSKHGINNSTLATGDDLDEYLTLIEESEVASKVDEEDEHDFEDKKTIKFKQNFSNIFSHRVNTYSDSYPFIYDATTKTLSFVNTKLDASNYFYIYLLISSNLDAINDSSHNLTTQFEKTSYFLFKYLLPENFSKVIYYGASVKNSMDIISSSKNKLIDKITELRDLLKISIHPYINEEEIGKYNNGDGGIDIVGYNDFNDDVETKIIFIGQCACGSEWEEKQIESNFINLDKFFHFFNKPTSVVLIPRSFRDFNNNWDKKSDILDCILIDRYRLILLSKLEKDKERLFKDSIPIINNVLRETVDFFA